MMNATLKVYDNDDDDDGDNDDDDDWERWC